MTILALPRKGYSKATQPINSWNQFIKEKPFEQSKRMPVKSVSGPVNIAMPF